MMKWLSIEKYIPSQNTDYFIFTINQCSYVAHVGDISIPDIWIQDYYCEKCQSTDLKKIYGVTHFAVINAVEIE